MVALIPGVSRSGATIVGSLLLGTDKRSAAEFSFFVAIPLMAGAFGYDLYKNRELISTELGLAVGVGFAAAFILAFIVVRYALDFISRHGFAPFAYWRIFVGAIGLWACCCSGEGAARRLGRRRRLLKPVRDELFRLVDADHLDALVADSVNLCGSSGAT